MADLTMPTSVASTVATPAASNFAIYFDSTLNCLCRKDTNGRVVPIADFTVNVLDFGADPTGVNDSTTAIKNAITAVAASATSSGIVWFPPGNYTANTGGISTGSTIIMFLGAGQYLSTISCNSPTADIIDVAQWYCQIKQLGFTSPTTTVAVASNGATISSLTVLNVASAVGFASSGTITVFNSTGAPQVINYTSITTSGANSFNGCTSSGSGTVATSGVVNQRTGGYAVNNSASQAYTLIRDCNILNQYNAVQLTGVLNTIEDTVISQTSNYGVSISTANAEIVLYNLTMNQLPQAVANIYVTSCGSLQILDCNLIHGGIDLYLNASSVGIFSVYASNTYFDTSTTALQLNGTSTTTVSRCQFVGCWFSSATNGMFAETLIVTGLSFVDCHFHNNSTYGIEIDECQSIDMTVIGCRFSSATTATGTGILLTASATTSSNYIITDNVIGANGGFNSFATGIQINSGTYARYTIANNDLSQNTLTLSDSGTATAKYIAGNIGCALPGAPSIASSGAINTTSTILTTANCNAGLQVGTTFRITILGTCTASAADTSTFTIRFGTAGTTGDGTIATGAVTSAATGTAVPFTVEIWLTIRTVGASTSATCYGSMRTVTGTSATGILGTLEAAVVALTDTAFNSQINGILSVGYLSSATTCTCTFQNAFIEVVKA